MYCIKCGKPIAQDEKFCANCGTAVASEQMTQGNCSYNPQYPSNDNQSVSKSSNNALFIIGVILLIASIVGTFMAVVTIAGDINVYHNSYSWGGYSYSGNLTSHEMQVITILMLSLGGGFVGLVMALINRKR